MRRFMISVSKIQNSSFKLQNSSFRIQAPGSTKSNNKNNNKNKNKPHVFLFVRVATTPTISILSPQRKFIHIPWKINDHWFLLLSPIANALSSPDVCLIYNDFLFHRSNISKNFSKNVTQHYNITTYSILNYHLISNRFVTFPQPTNEYIYLWTRNKFNNIT